MEPTPVAVNISVALQLVGAMSAWFIKPSYMLVALYLIVKLFRCREPEMRWIWWGLVAFDAGEAACAVNYLVFDLRSVLWEMAHDTGMVLAIGLITMGLLEIVDRRMLFQFVGGKSCALIRFCRECPVREGSTCRFKPFFIFVCAAGAFFSLVPLTKRAVIDSPMKVQFFGEWQSWYHLPVYQLFENRVCPAFAIALFALCALLLWLRSDPRILVERVVFSFAIAFLGFSLFRFANYRINHDWPVWFDFWEEATEWVSIIGLTIALHLFHDQLLEEPARSDDHA